MYLLVSVRAIDNRYGVLFQPTLLGSSSWDSQQPTVSSHSESSSQLREGIAVIERSTGRVIAGVAAPSQEELVHWLQDHPSFEVLCPTG